MFSDKVVEYNEEQINSGSFSDEHIIQLVAFWQEQHGLSIDGCCGPNTQKSLDAAIGPHYVTPPQLAGAMLQVAIENLGKGEEGGNNSGPFVEMLHGKEYDGDTDDDGAWCARFVSYCLAQACDRLDAVMPCKPSGGAKRLYKSIGKAGSFVEHPMPGDVVCWDRGKKGSWQGHIGIVERCEDGVLYTVEGNVGRYPSKVRRFKHDLKSQTRLEGFARLPTKEGLV